MTRFRREEAIGDARLILGDCREVLETVGPVDAVVTDPPYGLGDRIAKGGKVEWSVTSGDGVAWDSETSTALHAALTAAPKSIVWGGNYYDLPPSRCWLVWDKIQREFSSADCELAWTNLDQSVRALSLARTVLTPSHEGKKVHPTQKPLALMLWCLGFLPRGCSVLDPFMGSGTTGVACSQTGRTFVGIERDPGYFDIACRRIEAAYKQPRLFAEPITKPVQLTLLEGGADRTMKTAAEPASKSS